MNPSRNRKIAYLLAIVVLFTALIGLSRGVIEPNATEYRLTQSSLGKINPVSGTAQLVFFGFRGVAVTFLWAKATDLKMRERYFEIRPVLESITLLQPNFIKPWSYQAHNMAYNIAADWEAVDDKYFWIQEGIDYLRKACDNNEHVPELKWETGWFYVNRFSVADEQKYLREIFAKDPDDGYVLSRGNLRNPFDKGYDWFVVANRKLLEPPSKRPRNMGITPFIAYTAISRTKYADFLGQDGIFDENTLNGWRNGRIEWIKVGNGFDHPECKAGRHAYLHKLEFTQQEWDALSEEDQFWADHFRKIVRYYYWKDRCFAEYNPELAMQAARKGFYEGYESLKRADYATALKEYETAFPIWVNIFKKEPRLSRDDEFIVDCQEHEARYLRLVSRLGQEVPKHLSPRPFEGFFNRLSLEPIIMQRDLE